MKRLLKVSALSGMLTLLKMLMGFIIAKVIAVYTGPAGMAMLGQIQNIINSLNGIVNSPVSNGVVRFTAENNKSGFYKCSPWWRASLEWLIILCVITIPLGFLFSDYLSTWLFETKEFGWLIKLTVIFLPLTAFGTLISSVINGLENFRRYIILIMVSVLISSCLMIVMIIYAGLKGALIAAVFQSSMIGAVMLLTNIKQPWFSLTYWWGNTNSKARKDIAGYILMAVTSAITAPLSLILVRNIIIYHSGWEQAGQWQAVWKISEVYLSIITISLSTYFLPKLASKADVGGIIQEINKTALIVIPLAITMAVVVYAGRDIAIYILFTEQFRAARELFAIQLLGDIVKIISWLYAYPMLSRGATKWYVSTEILFSASFVILSWFLVGEYGNAHGANVAYLINYTFYFLFIIVNFKKIIK
ncbi:O184 family O-antigen flippase [Escherichia coli]|uniref:O184 family O-antigen flippase n=1 Tax=Escherichia coli TaxID=562 RepID=UPI001CA3A078|nr:O184 family O-antigen flippase [Escherichia coli]MBY8596976.1 O184 family O-antigen flippase [Escherichia coli]